jgi:pyruvate dehydrogenase E2 component (dihydrolipoamide acetyltransferase)
MALFEYKLPDIGEGVMEGEIVRWVVKPGDTVKEDDVLVEIMTDKATVTIPTPKAGKVLKTHGKEGDMAKVHHPLVDLEVGGSATSAGESAGAAPKTAASPAPEKKSVPAAAERSNGERVLATPVTRRMAAEHSVDLSAVDGTGPQGRVLKSDVLAHLERGDVKSPGSIKSPPAAIKSVVGDERIAIRGLRKKIADKMVKSKFTAPHYAFVEELDMTALVGLRNRLNLHLTAEKEDKLSFLPFFVKAVVAAFRKFPQVNAVMDEANQELVVRGERNIGIAAMTEQGLTVPVVKRADGLSIRQLAQEISRLGKAAREQKLKLDELTNGTFTITSLGQIGGLFATPIINHPEVAIMGIHKMRKQPFVTENDTIEIRQTLLLSFCFDHRVIDGALGAEFAYEVIRYLTQPELLTLDMV